MWKPPVMDFREENKLLNGIDDVIKEHWPHLEMYFTLRGWERKQRYK